MSCIFKKSPQWLTNNFVNRYYTQFARARFYETSMLSQIERWNFILCSLRHTSISSHTPAESIGFTSFTFFIVPIKIHNRQQWIQFTNRLIGASDTPHQASHSIQPLRFHGRKKAYHSTKILSEADT